MAEKKTETKCKSIVDKITGSYIYKVGMNMVIGGTAGVVAILVVQPLDFYKTRLQLASESNVGKLKYFEIFKNIVKN